MKGGRQAEGALGSGIVWFRRAGEITSMVQKLDG